MCRKILFEDRIYLQKCKQEFQETADILRGFSETDKVGIWW